MKVSKRKQYIVDFLIYSILFGILAIHIYKIDTIPNGINIDEMGMGYDAYCISNYGVDRYLKSFPVYLTNYGTGQSALYAYLCAILVKFCGLSVYTMRLPGIILLLISVWCGIKTMRIAFKGLQGYDVIYALGALIMPVYVMLFRIGMDCNLMLALIAVVMLYIAKCMDTNAYRDFIGLGISSGIILYTYALSYPAMLLFTVITFLYFLHMKKINWKQMLCWGIPLAVIALPLVLVQIINMFDFPEMNFFGITITKLVAYKNRKSEIALSNISIQSVATCIKTIFGYDSLRYNSLPEFGTVYYISIPFIVLGFIQCIYDTIQSWHSRKVAIEAAYLGWFMILFVIGCCLEANVNRMNAIYVSVLFFWSKGIYKVLCIISQKSIKYSFAGIISIAYLILFINFCTFYFGTKYRDTYEPLDFFGHMYGQDVLEYAIKLDQHLPIYSDDSYIYYLGTTLESPYDVEEDRDYQRFQFDYNGDVDYFGVFIVKNTNEGMKNALLRKGFLEKEFEHYSVYKYPFASKWEMLKEQEVTWNLGITQQNVLNLEQATQIIDGEENVVIVGWTYDLDTNNVWDKVYLQVGTQYYMAETTERDDVVEQMQNENLEEAGILFIIPKNVFVENNIHTVFLKCINEGKQKQLPIYVE